MTHTALAVMCLVLGSLAFAFGLTAIMLGVEAHFAPTVIAGALCLVLFPANLAVAWLNWTMRGHR